jgi:hypothetical protein
MTLSQDFPAWEALDAHQVIGPVKLFRAPYVPTGAVISPETEFLSMGILSNDGIEFDHKVTYAVSEVQQLLYALSAANTKQELDLKFTAHHIKPGRLPYFMGLPNVPVDAPSANNVRMLFGEPFDVEDAIDAPLVEANYGAWAFQFPSPSLNFSTTPKAAYAFFRAYKAAVTTHGAIKFTKTGYATIQCTLKCFADMSVAGPNKIGTMETVSP